MSTRFFCDACGVELRQGETNRLRLSRGKLGIEVMHRWDGTWNGGHICYGCIRDTILRGEPMEETVRP